MQRIADGFTGIARAAVTIPFDRAVHGEALRYDAVSTVTQNAWLAAGAAALTMATPRPAQQNQPPWVLLGLILALVLVVHLAFRCAGTGQGPEAIGAASDTG